MIECPPLFFALVSNDIIIRVSNPQFLFGVDLSTYPLASYQDFKLVSSLPHCEIDQSTDRSVSQRQRNRGERRQRSLSAEPIALSALLSSPRVVLSLIAFFEEKMATVPI